MERVKRQHRLDSGMRGWLVNTAKKNLWRVPMWYDLDDLIQDGYAVYCNCNSKYPHVTEIKHFMALVQVSYINHIHTLANNRTKAIISLSAYNGPLLASDEPEQATFYLLLRQLPVELQELVRFLAEGGARDITTRRYEDGTRETTNQLLCRLIGIKPDGVNLLAVFKEHFA